MTVEQLIADLALLGYRLQLSETGWPQAVPPAGQTDAVKDQFKLLLPHLRANRMAIVEHLADHCPLCEKVLACQEDKDRQADMRFCKHDGSFGPRCPYKPYREVR